MMVPLSKNRILKKNFKVLKVLKVLKNVKSMFFYDGTPFKK